MSEVKRLPERLECMVFRVRFAEEVAELQPVSDGWDSGKVGGADTEVGGANWWMELLLRDYYDYFFQSISAVTTACREIRTSRKFAKLLEVRLASCFYFRIQNVIHHMYTRTHARTHAHAHTHTHTHTHTLHSSSS